MSAGTYMYSFVNGMRQALRREVFVMRAGLRQKRRREGRRGQPLTAEEAGDSRRGTC